VKTAIVATSFSLGFFAGLPPAKASKLTTSLRRKNLRPPTSTTLNRPLRRKIYCLKDKAGRVKLCRKIAALNGFARMLCGSGLLISEPLSFSLI